MGKYFWNMISNNLRNSIAKGAVIAGIVTTTATGVGAGLEQQRKLDALKGLPTDPVSSSASQQTEGTSGNLGEDLRKMGIVSKPAGNSQTVRSTQSPATSAPEMDIKSSRGEETNPQEVTPPVTAAMEQFNELDELTAAAERKGRIEEEEEAKRNAPLSGAQPPDPDGGKSEGVTNGTENEVESIAFQGNARDNPDYGDGGGNQYFLPYANELKANDQYSPPGYLEKVKQEFEIPEEAKKSAPSKDFHTIQGNGYTASVDNRPLTPEEAAEFAQMEAELPEDLSKLNSSKDQQDSPLTKQEIDDLDKNTIDTKGLSAAYTDSKKIEKDNYRRPLSNQEDGQFMPDGWKNPRGLKDGQVLYQLSVDGNTTSPYFTDQATVDSCRDENGNLDFNQLRAKLQIAETNDGKIKGCLTKYIYHDPQVLQHNPPPPPPSAGDGGPDNTPPPNGGGGGQYIPPPNEGGSGPNIPPPVGGGQTNSPLADGSVESPHDSISEEIRSPSEQGLTQSGEILTQELKVPQSERTQEMKQKENGLQQAESQSDKTSQERGEALQQEQTATDGQTEGGYEQQADPKQLLSQNGQERPTGQEGETSPGTRETLQQETATAQGMPQRSDQDKGEEGQRDCTELEGQAEKSEGQQSESERKNQEPDQNQAESREGEAPEETGQASQRETHAQEESQQSDQEEGEEGQQDRAESKDRAERTEGQRPEPGQENQEAGQAQSESREGEAPEETGQVSQQETHAQEESQQSDQEEVEEGQQARRESEDQAEGAEGQQPEKDQESSQEQANGHETDNANAQSRQPWEKDGGERTESPEQTNESQEPWKRNGQEEDSGESNGREEDNTAQQETSSSEGQPWKRNPDAGDRDRDDQRSSSEDQAPWQKHDGQEDTQNADDIPEKENESGKNHENEQPWRRDGGEYEDSTQEESTEKGESAQKGPEQEAPSQDNGPAENNDGGYHY